MLATARSAQSARKHSFSAANFAAIRLEDLDAVARPSIPRSSSSSSDSPSPSRPSFAPPLSEPSCLNETLQRDDDVAEELTRDIGITKVQSRACTLVEVLQLEARPFLIQAGRSAGWGLLARVD